MTDSTDVEDLRHLRRLLAEQLAAGVQAREVSAIVRQLVRTVVDIHNAPKPPAAEEWLPWFQRRFAALGDSYGTGDEIETDWLASNPEPPRPTPRGTPAPITDDPEETNTDADH